MKENGFTLREAAEQDIPQMAIHHRLMFEEIWEKRGEQIETCAGREIERAYSSKLSAELPTGSCKAWLIERGNQIVASGAISVVSFVPTPMDFSSRVAYLHSMYTEAGERGKNYASRIVKAALEYCKTNGIKRVILNASEAGRPIYEKIGFASSPEMMRIFVG